jgi:exoribonuclease R
MRSLADPGQALAGGLAAIRARFGVPDGFPEAVLTEAEAAAARTPDAHADRTGHQFVTLDPAEARDLDQAFAIEPAGGDLLLHYAIADVGWFVAPGGALDAEAWRRGTTLYLPDGKAGLYPPALSEGAASLLPDGPRPAAIFTVRVGADGTARLDGAERAIVRSRAKLAYETVRDADLPEGFAELTDRLQAAEARRGAARVDPPAQEVTALPGGGFALAFAPRLEAEDRNASLSLAANMAVAEVLLQHRTGLFRVMAEPDARAIGRLRHTARAFGMEWPKDVELAAFERGLNGAEPREAAFMLAIRRAGPGAGYAAYDPATPPWHAAVAAAYAHATAPLRRLADRYVIEAVLALAAGRAIPEWVAAAFEKLPPAMARAEAKANAIDRAVIDLAEAVMLEGEEGRTFEAIVTDIDQRGARIQLKDLPVVARVAAHRVAPGGAVRVRLTEANPVEGRIAFQRVG